MQDKIKAIPTGYHNITPYLVITDDASEAIDFYKEVFGATETLRIGTPEGKVGHAELLIGDSRLMVADACPEMPASLSTTQNPGISLHLYIEDVDTVVKKALSANAKLLQPISDKFYGDRSGTIVDPFGHTWTVSSHIEDVPLAELKTRAQTQGRSLKNEMK